MTDPSTADIIAISFFRIGVPIFIIFMCISIHRSQGRIAQIQVDYQELQQRAALAGSRPMPPLPRGGSYSDYLEIMRRREMEHSQERLAQRMSTLAEAVTGGLAPLPPGFLGEQQNEVVVVQEEPVAERKLDNGMWLNDIYNS